MYREISGKRVWLVLTDVLVVAWIWFWVWLAIKLYDLTEKLGVLGQRMEGAGNEMSGGLSDAGSGVGRVPVVGGEMSKPFNRAADAARSLADAGRQQQHIVHELAWALALLLLFVPVCLVLFCWLPLRLRRYRRARAAAALRKGRAGQDLLALRALANRPLRRLARIDADPVAGWRRGDQLVVEALAGLELRHFGLRAPRGSTGPD